MRTVYVYKWLDDHTTVYMGTLRIPSDNFLAQLKVIHDTFGDDCVWYNRPILDPDALNG